MLESYSRFDETTLHSHENLMRKTIHPLTLLRTSIHTIYQNPIILYPTLVLALIQFLALETLYFAPRYPLSNFFGPLISHIWSEDFLHYPMDLILLPKLFYYAQIIIYLFLGNAILAITSYIVASLDTHHRINLKYAVSETGRCYVHILCSSLISLTMFQLLSTSYSTMVNFILRMKTSNFTLEAIQKIFLWATPYAQFLIGIFVTTLLIYIVPIIILEKRKIIGAVRLNFAMLYRSLGSSFIIVSIPTLFYFPILAARNNIEWLVDITIPEIQIFIIIFGILVTMAIDLMVITSITTYYLFLKEK